MRVPDETMIDDLEDEDIVGEQNIDEFDKYFNRETKPKILVTTNRRPKGVSILKIMLMFVFLGYI